MSENIENIRSRSREARLRLEGKYGIAPASDLTNQQARLASLFSDVTSSREQMIARFSELSALRVEAYESLISGYTASYHSSNISVNVAEITVLLRALEIVSSSEFKRNFDSAVYVLENSYDDRTLESIAAYFDSKFEELAAIAFPEGTEVEYVVGTGLQEDSATVSDPASQDNKIYLVLEVIGKLKNIQDESIWSDLSAYKSFITGGSELEFPSIVRSNIAARSEAISDTLASIKFMALHRAENDPSYREEIDTTISATAESISDALKLLSDLSGESVEASFSNGSYDRVASAASKLQSESDDLVRNSLQAVSDLESYLEDYQAFVRLPQDESAAVENAISVCEGADASYAQYQEQLESGSFFSPFSTQSGGRTRLSFSEWKSRATRNRLMNGSSFEMAVLYMGSQGRSFLPQETHRLMSNYAFSSMYRKGLVRPEVLNSLYRGTRELSSSLFRESGVRVTESPDDERLPLALRASLPGLETLDYLSYSDALNFSDASPDPDEVSLRNNIRLIILESLGRVRKEDLAGAIRSTISAASSYRRENLKGLYTEACLREAIQLLEDHLETVGDSYPELTRIDVNTRNQMQQYLSVRFNDSEEAGDTLDRWLSDYISVHTALYGGTSSGDLLDDALLDGTDLKTHLIGQ